MQAQGVNFRKTDFFLNIHISLFPSYAQLDFLLFRKQGTKIHLKKQARKPRSYASPKLRLTDSLTDRGKV